MDVKSAFRQVGVDPDGTPAFAYHLGMFVDFRLSSSGGGAQGGKV